MILTNEIKEVLKRYNLTLDSIPKHLQIPGSPERSLFRTVIEDNNKELFLVEQISEENVEKKDIIAKTLHKIKLEQVNPYLKNADGKFITKNDDDFFMVSGFIKGTELERPDYIYDEERGKNLAQFLIAMNKENISLENKEVFDIKRYVEKFMQKLKDPKLKKELTPIYEFLKEDFFEQAIPVKVCHGDFHPINIIWDNKKIKSVIDWEFLGYNIENYDIANMIGCVGFENPKAFENGLIPAFIKTLEEDDFLSLNSWKYLKHTIIANRFGWLREWMHKKDHEMLELELKYMKILKEKFII